MRVIQLTYNPANHLGDGSMAPEDRGLTPFGREVVERLNAQPRHGRPVALRRDRPAWTRSRASKQPISINHTGCRALTDLPRNKTDEELRLVAEQGRLRRHLLHAVPEPRPATPTPTDVVAHIEHAVNVCGEDHVGIGTDGSARADRRPGRLQGATLAKEHVAERAKAGIAAAGERADTYPFVDDLRGLDQFRKLDRLLAARGHTRSGSRRSWARNFIGYAARGLAARTSMSAPTPTPPARSRPSRSGSRCATSANRRPRGQVAERGESADRLRFHPLPARSRAVRSPGPAAALARQWAR